MFNPKPLYDENFSWPFQCIWLKLNGSWPLQSIHSNRWWNFWYNMWSWYIIVSVGITISYQTAFLINNLSDIMMTTENCCTTLMGALNFIRLLHMRLWCEPFRQIMEQFVNDIWIIKKEHPKISLECKKEMNTFHIMTILLSCLITMYCTLPIIVLFVEIGWDAPDKPFPYKMLFPYDASQGWRYILTYAFTSYAGICVITTLFAEDSIFGFFLIYTCGKFRLLHQRIDNLIPQAHALVGNDYNNKNKVQLWYIRLLKEIARDHYKLIEYSKKMEDFFSPILLVNFLISSVLICMVGFQFVISQHMFIGDYVKFIVYILSSLSQLYILCWNGDRLIQNSSEMSQHLYDCNWEGGGTTTFSSPIAGNDSSLDKCKLKPCHPANKEFKQNLQIMIACSQRPVQITAFKFSVLSLQSFAAILSTSMSYFTLLKTVYNDDQQVTA